MKVNNLVSNWSLNKLFCFRRQFFLGKRKFCFSLFILYQEFLSYKVFYLNLPYLILNTSYIKREPFTEKKNLKIKWWKTFCITYRIMKYVSRAKSKNTFSSLLMIEWSAIQNCTSYWRSDLSYMTFSSVKMKKSWKWIEITQCKLLWC